MMSRDEERQLREIEQSLADEDPKFATSIGAAEPMDVSVVATWATMIIAVGCALALLGLLLGSGFGWLGVLMAVAGYFLRSTLRAPRGRGDLGGDDDTEPGTGHDGARI